MKQGKRFYVTLRRTVTEEQAVEFIVDSLATSEMQTAVAAAYARPEAWVIVKADIERTGLSSENIEWDQTSE